MAEKETTMLNGAPPQMQQLITPVLNDGKNTQPSPVSFSHMSSSQQHNTSSLVHSNTRPITSLAQTTSVPGTTNQSSKLMLSQTDSNPTQRLNYSQIPAQGKQIIKSNHSLDHTNLVNGQSLQFNRTNPQVSTQVINNNSPAPSNIHKIHSIISSNQTTNTNVPPLPNQPMFPPSTQANISNTHSITSPNLSNISTTRLITSPNLSNISSTHPKMSPNLSNKQLETYVASDQRQHLINAQHQNNLNIQPQGSSLSLQATPTFQNKTQDFSLMNRKSSDSGLMPTGDVSKLPPMQTFGSSGQIFTSSPRSGPVLPPMSNPGATPMMLNKQNPISMGGQAGYSPQVYAGNSPVGLPPGGLPRSEQVSSTNSQYTPLSRPPVNNMVPGTLPQPLPPNSYNRPMQPGPGPVNPVSTLQSIPPPPTSQQKLVNDTPIPAGTLSNNATPQYGNNMTPQYGSNATPQYGNTMPNQYGNNMGPAYGSGGPPQPQYGNNTTPMNNRYPGMNRVQQGMGNLSVAQQGFNKLWGIDTIDLLQCRNVLGTVKVDPPMIKLNQEVTQSSNCNPDIFRCTLNKIPESNSLLQKSRLPLGILIHPFRDLSQLAVIQCATIVRCRACRTYINPFVYFIDNKRWKCNLCFRANELPDEFQYDPVSKTYGDPTRRPEVKSATIEFIAPSEYMLRPPQPAIYLFVLDVSRIACETGYLEILSTILLEELDNLPGDSRTQIGFILFDSCVHFFSIADNFSQAHEMIVTDIDDVFLPTPDSLLVNLNENRQLIKDLLVELPKRYSESFDTNSALGAALQAAYKLMAPTGGRITVFQSCLPNFGPGSLQCREDPNQRAGKEVNHLGPQTDFYKRLSLDCSTQQISVDLFLCNGQYADLATLSGVSQFSGGCVYHFPLFKKQNSELTEKLVRTLRRYLTRKIGFEAVMRIRCSRGLSIHTFHGNFFVRSTDLLSLPNVNPDAGFGMQVSIEESLSELESVCFQAALLYTSAKGERRIRVHTLCLPVTTSLSEVLTSSDQQCIMGLLSKMAVDRSLKSSVSDARDAFINVAIDVLAAYKLVETAGGYSGLLAPSNLALIPLYILALLKSTAFRTGQSTRLDDRVYAMLQMKTLPLKELIQSIHFDLYNITCLDDKTNVEFDGQPVAQPPKLTLSSEQIDFRGCYLLDTPDTTYIIVGKTISPTFVMNIFGSSSLGEIDLNLMELPELDNEDSKKLRHFINYLHSEKPWSSVLKILVNPASWSQFLITDRSESSLSYYEFLQHIKTQIK